ncbi:MAG TPA: DUF2723 domain-containing protein, partial [Candidatus Acidoferrales bacterium]|nr:DUF2723 domain-containing protein [Candidatus Acidoferrales bacterium]
MTEPTPRPYLRYAVALAAGSLPLCVYLRTMAPTVYGLDSAELTTGAYVLGIVHSPGAPLFLLLAHVFTWLPVGDVGYRVNLVSACSGAAAVALSALLLERLTGRVLVAVAGSWLLAFSYYYWVSALAAELYAPMALSIVVLLLLADVWRRRRQPWQLWLFTFIFGLALGNHMSLGAMAPGFAYLLLSDRTWPRLPVIAGAMLFGVAGACIYLYIPLRAAAGPPLDYARDFGVDA